VKNQVINNTLKRLVRKRDEDDEDDLEGKFICVMKARACEGVVASFLTSALDGCVVSLTPLPCTLGTHSIGGWVGPKAGLDPVEKRKYFDSAGNRTPAFQRTAYSLY
jgi:hypothetical protein